MKKSKTIRIAAISDIHGFLDGLKEEIEKAKPDLLVIAGDIHPCRLDVNAADWFTKTFFSFISSLKCEVVVTPGNHDFFISDLLCANLTDRCPSNLHILRDTEICLCGLKIYGTPWVEWINGQWCYEARSRTLKSMFSKIPYNLDVLITHAPPLIPGKNIDVSVQNDYRYWRHHFGSTALYEEIIAKSPRYVFCGHIHSGEHKKHLLGGKDGSAIEVYNVSRVDERYRVSYQVRVVTLEK